MNIKEKRMDRYEEAMSRMLQWEKEHPDGYNIDAMKIFVFPELKESEDERIRKWLIDYFDKVNDEVVKEDRLKIITYLEKQKEQKLISFNESYNPDDYEVVMKGNATSLKRKEQKPAKKQDYSGLNDLERAIHRGFLCAGVENVPVGIIKDTAQDCLTQIKPAEWKEEDEGMLNCIIATLCEESHGGRESNGKMVIWLENRLKSLRPQPHWKPSKEQMEALKLIVSNKKHYAPVLHEIALDTLYNDLLKLL